MHSLSHLRAEFPILNEKVHGLPLVYLDNANTTQKPQKVIQAIQEYYTHYNANIHRSVYTLSEKATQLFEATRDKIQHFIQAPSREEIIFTKGTTESINLVAHGLTESYFKPGDEIVISELEHHANIIPWQWVCQKIGGTLKIIPIQTDGSLDLEVYAQLLTEKTRLVAITHVSNVTGIINPIAHMISLAHEKNIPVFVDGAQGIVHLPVDVQALDCDFYAFSSHKLYGPTGVGILYGKKKWLSRMPPYQGGGSMIKEVTFEKTTYNDLPYKFEAGTPNIAGVVGFGAAIDYLNELNTECLIHHEQKLLSTALEALRQLPEVRLLGIGASHVPVVSFTLKGIHPHDAGTALDADGIAVRVGHHCAMPLMARFGVPATIRISFAIYNTLEEIDLLLTALKKIISLFGSHSLKGG